MSTSNFAVGPAIEIKTLSALAWMQFGSEVSTGFPTMHLVAACDRILQSNKELMRRAEKKLQDGGYKEQADILFASQQAVLDLVIATSGAPEVIDGANAEQIMRALNTTAEARGRRAERLRQRNQIDALKNQLNEKINSENNLVNENMEILKKQRNISIQLKNDKAEFENDCSIIVDGVFTSCCLMTAQIINCSIIVLGVIALILQLIFIPHVHDSLWYWLSVAFALVINIVFIIITTNVFRKRPPRTIRVIQQRLLAALINRKVRAMPNTNVHREADRRLQLRLSELSSRSDDS